MAPKQQKQQKGEKKPGKEAKEKKVKPGKDKEAKGLGAQKAAATTQAQQARVRSAYRFFCAHQRAAVLEQHGKQDTGGNLGEVSKLLAQAWTDLSLVQKAAYHACATVDKHRVALEALRIQNEEDAPSAGRTMGGAVIALSRAPKEAFGAGVVEPLVQALETVDRKLVGSLRTVAAKYFRMSEAADELALGSVKITFSEDVIERLATLLMRWGRVGMAKTLRCGNDKQGPKPVVPPPQAAAGGGDGAAAEPGGGSSSPVDGAAGDGQGGPDDDVRGKVVGMLMRTTFKKGGTPQFELCKKIEVSLHEQFGSEPKEYKRRARSLSFNLGAADGTLFRRVSEGEITTSELVRLGCEELASETLKNQREEERQRYFRSEVHDVQGPPKRRKDLLYLTTPDRWTGDMLDACMQPPEESQPQTQEEVEPPVEIPDGDEANDPGGTAGEVPIPLFSSFTAAAAPSRISPVAPGNVAPPLATGIGSSDDEDDGDTPVPGVRKLPKQPGQRRRMLPATRAPSVSDDSTSEPSSGSGSSSSSSDNEVHEPGFRQQRKAPRAPGRGDYLASSGGALPIAGAGASAALHPSRSRPVQARAVRQQPSAGYLPPSGSLHPASYGIRSGGSLHPGGGGSLHPSSSSSFDPLGGRGGKQGGAASARSVGAPAPVVSSSLSPAAAAVVDTTGDEDMARALEVASPTSPSSPSMSPEPPPLQSGPPPGQVVHVDLTAQALALREDAELAQALQVASPTTASSPSSSPGSPASVIEGDGGGGVVHAMPAAAAQAASSSSSSAFIPALAVARSNSGASSSSSQGFAGNSAGRAHLMAMGFPSAVVDAALRQAQGRVEGAVAILCQAPL